MKHFLNICLWMVPMLTTAQIQDDFSDGDFTANPAWAGTNSNFIVNSGKQLQSHATVAGTSYLSTPHGLPDLNGKEWRFYVKQTFAGSSSNFSRIYLSAASPDLALNSNGYYIQLGESLTTDAVRLMRYQDGLSSEICSGTSGAIASAVNVGIRVVHDAAGNWSLYVDYAGGTNYVYQSAGNDSQTLIIGSYTGFLCTYTASNANKFYFDNVYAGNEILDTEAPSIVAATALNSTNVDLLFSENIEQSSGESSSNYLLSPANGIVAATRDQVNHALIHLLLSGPLGNGVTNQVTASHISDLAGNSGTQTATFTFLVSEAPQKGDVIINEFMCDPSPVVGLPELEYVEIYNKSNKFFNLNGWKLGDNASDGTIANAWLFPGEHKVLCSSSSTESFHNSVAVISFPSLNNTGDDIVLKDNTGIVLDKITYSDKWYQDNVKKAGGYSIELINPQDPCSDISNWKASNDPLGGTPGNQNSVYDDAPDLEIPTLKSILAVGPNLLELDFNEGMDSASIQNSILLSNPGLTVASIILDQPFSSKVVYEFYEDLAHSQIYQFNLNNLADCWLNQTSISGEFVLPDSAEAGDLVINEILFNPITAGYDFVEIRNNSGKMIDLHGLRLANFDDDTIANMRKIEVHFILKKGEYAVVTPDSMVQLQIYPSAIPGRFIQMSLPSWNNDSGTVYLLSNTQVLDQVSYDEHWHFKLIDDKDGKSLERIDPEGKSNDPKNWHTAAESIGFATPGRENSQYSESDDQSDFSFTSDIFSPDNDGNEDVLQVNYILKAPGFLGNIHIYDDRGRLVKNLIENELLGIKGSIVWDGLTDSNQKSSIGTYVLVFETFHIEGGSVSRQKKAFVLAGKI